MKLLAPNTLLQNRYLIVHLIGKGGMGEVYLAVDQRLGSVIALKRTFFSDDLMLGTAFEREARTLARLRHPVLPKVSDHFTENETQYLVMEHISGEDLSERLKTNKKPFPLNWVLFWADQLLDALAYLHTHEPPIIHRDIKPQNLKLSAENHIVLLDFGLAKNSLAETRASTSGSVVGYTPHYAPMEQIRGTGTDARSDIYSLSATIYQILTDVVPPDALTRADAVISGKADPLQPINEINTEVSKLVSDVIIKGMSISQEARYASARLMQKALRDAYAELQTGSAEQTVSFDAPSNVADVLQPKPKSEFNTSPPIISQVPAVDLQTQMSATDSDSGTPKKANGYSPKPPSFNTTLQNDSNAVSEQAQRQSDIKTEVFLAGSLPEIAVDRKSNAPQENFAKDANLGAEVSLKETRQYSAKDFNSPKGYSPEATVPLISVNNKNDEVSAYPMETAAEFDLIPQADKFDPSENAEADFQREERRPETSVQPKRKSNALAIVGGLAALLLLIAGAVAAGWFVFARPKSPEPEISIPAATPEPTVSVAPTPEPTLEAVTETNANVEEETAASDSNNSLTSETNQTANVENKTGTSNKAEKPVQTDQQAPVRTSVAPKQTPQIETVKAQKPVPQAKPKPTPKVGRTDILQ